MREKGFTRRSTRGGLLLALALAACGGPTEFVPTPTTGPPALPTSTVLPSAASTLPAGVARRQLVVEGSPITVSYDDGMPGDIILSIEEMLPLARQDLGDSGPLVVHVYATVDAFVAAHAPADRRRAQQYADAGIGASASPGAIWFYGPNYAPSSDRSRRMVIFHEYFHTVQFTLSNRQTAKAPTWLLEGTARYVEVRLGSRHGYVDFDRVRLSEIGRSRDLGPLQTFETRAPVTAPGASGPYALGFVAADYLVNKVGLDAVERLVWTELRIKDWRAAFAAAFGEPVEQFYASFEDYRRSL